MQTAAGLQAAKRMSDDLNNLGELMLTAAPSAGGNAYISEACAKAVSFIADEVPITNMEKLMCESRRPPLIESHQNYYTYNS